MAAKKMRWCAVSDPEQRKCAELAKALAAVVSPATLAAFARLSCIRASSTTDCINRIKVSKSTMQYTIKRRFNPAWSKLFKVACISNKGDEQRCSKADSPYHENMKKSC